MIVHQIDFVYSMYGAQCGALEVVGDYLSGPALWSRSGRQSTTSEWLEVHHHRARAPPSSVARTIPRFLSPIPPSLSASGTPPSLSLAPDPPSPLTPLSPPVPSAPPRRPTACSSAPPPSPSKSHKVRGGKVRDLT
jgi:hypothetical protein